MNTADRSDREKIRSEMRKNSGVRIGCIWSVTLVILLIIYLAGFAILRHFNQRNWSDSINRALKQGDPDSAEALLNACRREMPALSRRADFAVWERQLQNLKNKRQQKHLRFERKLRNLREQLEREDADPQLLLMYLAEVARECSDEDQLGELRELQLRCEALARMRELVSARSGSLEIAGLQKQVADAAILLDQHEYTRFFELLELCDERSRQLVQKYYNIQSIAARGRALQEKIRSLRRQGSTQQQEFNAAKADFLRLLQALSAEELAAACQGFLKKYPSDIHRESVENLLKELTFFKSQTWRADLQRQQRRQQLRLQNARQLAIKLIQKFMAENYTVLTYELALRLSDGKRISWECYTQEAFSPANPQGVITITFRDTRDRLIRGEFSADGQGRITEGKNIYRGKLENRLPAGGLQQPYWQQKLKIFDGVETLDFLHFLSVTLPETVNDRALPETLRGKLDTIYKRILQELKSTPEQYVFTDKILDFCLKSHLRFAGVVWFDNNISVVSSCVYDRVLPATVWLLGESHNQVKIRFYGTVRSRRITVEATGKNFSNAHVLAVMENGADFCKQFRLWQQEAAAGKLELPPLPEFLQLK